MKLENIIHNSEKQFNSSLFAHALNVKDFSLTIIEEGNLFKNRKKFECRIHLLRLKYDN